MPKSKGGLLLILYNRISALCEEKGISLYRMCKEVGLPVSTTTELKSGRVKSLSQKKLEMISDFFGVSVDYLVGKTNSPLVADNGNVLVPVYGQIAAGFPVDMEVDIEDYEEISAAMAAKGEHFGLRIKGDSMEPQIPNKAVVIVRKQETCDDGDICAVAINGDYATCKRVKRMPEGILLVSLNQAYEPMFYSNKQIEALPVTILGKVVEHRVKYE